jgi:phage tail-like protein
MALTDQSAIGLGNRFFVQASPGNWDLGSWSKVDGLDVTWEVPDYRMGDQWNQRLFAPANTKYTAVKMTRAAEKKDSKTVRDWLAKNSMQHDIGGWIKIELRDSFNKPVIDWTLRNAVVKKWGLTTMDAGSSTVAIETLEIEHEGFLDDDQM